MITRILLIICLTVTNGAIASGFEEGKHYQVLSQQVSNKIEVREYFSFYCGHCFAQEPLMKDIDSALPDGMVLQKNHVDGMPGKDVAIEQALSKALIVAQLLKVEQQMVPLIFDHIHVKKGSFASEQEVRDLFIRNGIDADKFDKAYKSYGVNSRFKNMVRNTSSIRSQGIIGVPTLIINGKYRPLTENIKTSEEYKSLVIYLLDKKS